MSAAVETLVAARARIEDPNRWTRGAYARDAKGWMAVPDSPSAVCWCAYGALELARGRCLLNAEELELEIASREIFGIAGVQVNDTLGHAAVMRVCDRAIELARAEEESHGR